jgi:hypothetical protein
LQKASQLELVADQLRGRFLSELLGAVDGKTVQFNIMETGSSIMSERSSVSRTIETRTTSTLDSLPISLVKPTLIKIDAQGYELEILKGATISLNSIEAILLEVSVMELNDGAPLLHEVVSFMKDLGFLACDLLEIHRRPLDRALSQIDLMFVRQESSLLADDRYSA